MTISTTAFDLRDLIRAVLEASADVHDINIIAKEVSRKVDDNHLREALDQALPLLVQNTISRDRGRLIRDPRPPAEEASSPVRSVPEMRSPEAVRDNAPVAPRFSSYPAPEQRSTPELRPAVAPAPAAKSWKVAAYRKYGAELRKLYATDFSPSSHKPLGKFTLEDCQSAEVMNRKLAAGNVQAAERWVKYAEALAASKAKRIEQLSDKQLDKILGSLS
jgi:hypothetical protein